jgi:hypothetical protein
MAAASAAAASAAAPPAAAALAPDTSSASSMAAGQATADLSGALAWVSAVPQPAGRMRAWLDVEPVDGRPESMLWTASLVLLRHLETEHPAAYWRGKRVLELGAGMGHLAVGLARLGAQVTATEAGYSGLDVLQAWSTHLLKERASGGEAAGDGALSAGCDAHGGTVSTRELWWGARDGLSESFEEGFDVIILDNTTLTLTLALALTLALTLTLALALTLALTLTLTLALTLALTLTRTLTRTRTRTLTLTPTLTPTLTR